MNRALPPANLLRSAGAPHPAAKPDSSRLVYPTRLSASQIWLYGVVEHPPSVVENLCGTGTEVVFTWRMICQFRIFDFPESVTHHVRYQTVRYRTSPAFAFVLSNVTDSRVVWLLTSITLVKRR